MKLPEYTNVFVSTVSIPHFILVKITPIRVGWKLRIPIIPSQCLLGSLLRELATGQGGVNFTSYLPRWGYETTLLTPFFGSVLPINLPSETFQVLTSSKYLSPNTTLDSDFRSMNFNVMMIGRVWVHLYHHKTRPRTSRYQFQF